MEAWYIAGIGDTIHAAPQEIKSKSCNDCLNTEIGGDIVV